MTESSRFPISESVSRFSTSDRRCPTRATGWATRARLTSVLALIVSSAIVAGPAGAQTPGTPAHNSCECSVLTLAKSVPLGADRTVLVSVAMIAGSESLSSVTYNGNAMTQIGTSEHSGNARIYLFEQKLGTGSAISANVVVTRSSSAKMVVGALDYAGVSQTQTLTTTAAFGKGRVASVTRPGVASGQVVVDAIAMKSVPSPSLSVGSGQTLLWSRNQSSNGTGAQSSKPHAGGTGSVTVSYDKGSGNENEWAMLATTLTAAAPPTISVVKSTTSTFTAAGGTLTYGFTVENTGNVTVTNVSLSDPLVSGSPIAGCAALSLAPGAQKTCSATYTTTQADVDAGEVVNTASATSTETGAVSSNKVTVPFTGTVTKSLRVVKSTTSTFTAAGGTLTYGFTVENTGNVTVTNVSLSDPLVSGSPIAGCAASSLAPGAQTTCAGTYTTTQADVDAGEVVNTASATSTETGVVSSNKVTVPFTGTVTKSLSVVKSTTSSFTAAAVTLAYNFAVENTGTVTLTSVSLSDPLVSGSPIAGCAASSLAPGAQTTCAGTYTTVQADVDAGQVVNTATATSTETGAVSSNTVTLAFAGVVGPALNVVMTSSSAFTAAGGVIAYEFLVQNTGNITLTNVSLSAPLVSDSPIAGCTVVSLAPGAQTTCSGGYTAKQADVDAGQIVNTATATSTETGSVSSNTLTLTFAGGAGPALTVLKSSSSSFTAAGEALTYDFVVQNTGNITLTDVSLSDPLVSDAPIAGCAAASLAPGAQTTCTGTYTTTPADVAAGQVVNVATATSAQTGAVASDKVTISFTGGNPALSAVKSTTSVFTAAGAALVYGFTVENTGTVTLTHVSLSDPLVSDAPIAGCAAASLAPGAKATCSATYTTAQADVDTGQVANTAVATSSQTGAVNSNTVILPFTGTVVHSLTVRLASDSTFTGPGVPLTYDVSLENTGNVTLTDVGVSASPTGPVAACSAASLAPGATTTCSAVYTSTQEDVDAGQVVHSATAVSSQTGSVTSNVLALPFTGAAAAPADRPSMAVTVTSSSTTAVAGMVLTYDFVVENTGNVPLTNVGLRTLLAPGSVAGCAAESLAPGAKITCSATYTTSDADLHAGRIENVATVSSTETGNVTSNVVVVLVTIDEQLVRDSFGRAGRAFMLSRLNGILFSEPDSPRLINRGRSGSGGGPVGLIGQGDGNRLNLAWNTSLTRIRQSSSAHNGGTDDQIGGARPFDGLSASGGRFDIWVEGTYYRQSRTLEAGQERGEVGLAYTGVDYLLTDRLLVGVLTQFDWGSNVTSAQDDIGRDRANGFGWMVGPYVSARLGGGILVDVRSAWGRSDNDMALRVSGIDFDGTFTTNRRLVRATISGETAFEGLRIRPTASLAYMEDAQDDYLARSSRANVLVTGQSLALGRVMSGPELSYRFTQRAVGHVEPFFAPSLVWDVEREKETTFDPFRRAADSRRGALATGVRFMLKRYITADAVLGVDGFGEQDFSASSFSARIVIPF